MICFVGMSFAPMTLKLAAKIKGFQITDNPSMADLVFVSEDTPTDENSVRDLETIRKLTQETFARTKAPVVLTSQVPPGFTRSLKLPIYHQAETLRIVDAMDRALNPEQHIIGCEHPSQALPKPYLAYLIAFNCPVFQVSYEEAEFAKIAINLTLAAQVENTNRLAEAARRCGADWEKIAMILKHDRRIGHHSYLQPGDWKKSLHLLRDSVTFDGL